ncbi:PREDICTED: G-type lectin S-receptor-like serine/threonine-protein kinase LECRK3 isoform X2 [Theobroma cacao]|uniref:non-specific serine/threonine protein kinase n=1 Tax=Theobroma cacao TaxID=3641 RepID=A0AB32WUF0_THECC|nr:PREDICTED: G-type lectin S-receptor-like serine/threonine-protein kinase LECRK3 isoform X2 [Theobroma cacao]
MVGLLCNRSKDKRPSSRMLRLLPQPPCSTLVTLFSLIQVRTSYGRLLIPQQTPFYLRNGNLAQYPLDSVEQEAAYWNTGTFNAGDNVTLNLDSNGQLYLINSTALVVKNITKKVSVSGKLIYRATIDADGIFRLYSHSFNQSGNWSIEWSSSNNRCVPKGLCGVNSYCTLMDREPVCQCPLGFDFIDQGQKDLGCQKIYSADACTRKSKQSFDVYELSSVTWEEDPYATLQELSKDDCREECFRDCNCEVALYGSARQICKKLKLPLRYGRRRLGGRWTTFVKIGTGVRTIVGGKGKKSEVRMDIFITGIGSLTLAFFVLASSGIFIYRHRIQQSRRVSDLRDNGFVEEVTLKSFTYEELKHATNNFTDNIGKGAFGTVFRGVISNGKKIVAIKRLEKVVAEGEREFRNEVKAIGQTHHKNLVQLLGYCYDGTNRLLVYEYKRNGSLADFLFRSSLKINWEGRIAIILNIARGIFYLHEECEIRIIHCDIKPENILLDDKGYAKIADFGLAKLLMPNQSKTYTGIRGTRGYVAPEWHRNLPITVKADVYSFGIMLFEIICCRRNVEADVPDNEAVLVNWVYDCFKANELEKLLQEDEVEKEKLERVVKVGLWCTQDEPSSRPSMKKVILMLEGTVNVPDPPCPTFFLAPHRPYLSSAENNEV